MKRVAAFAVAGVLLSAIALLAVGTRSSTPASEPGAASGPSRIVILFDVDMLRADRLGTYGYERPTSPNLDRVMADGLVAEHAITSAGWTLPAHASMFSSQPVSAHGVRSAGQKVPATVPLLAEVLSRSGVLLPGIQSGGYVDSGFGFSRGFDSYIYSADQIATKVQGALRLVDQAGAGPVLPLSSHRSGSRLPGDRAWRPRRLRLRRAARPAVDRAVRRARQGPRDARRSERIASWLSARYDAAIREVDESLGELVAGLQARELWDRTALVLTSDHGEELGERPLKIADSAPARGHTIPYLYEEHVRVPLALRAPWRKDLRGRIAQPVSTLDVAPTILDLFDVAIPPGMTGVSLGRPRPAGRVVVSEAAPYGAVALLEGSHKVIVRPGLPRPALGDRRLAGPSARAGVLRPWPGPRRAQRDGLHRAVGAQRSWAKPPRYVASSFPGDFVIRAEPRGGPCRLDMGSATDVRHPVLRRAAGRPRHDGRRNRERRPRSRGRAGLDRDPAGRRRPGALART